MDFWRRNFSIIFVAVISFVLGGAILYTSSRLGQEKPVAPTVPQAKPRAVDGSPVPACISSFTIVLASPPPTPPATPRATPTATPPSSNPPTPQPSATPPATPRATPPATPPSSNPPTPQPSATPRATPRATPQATPVPMCIAVKIYQIDQSGNWFLVPNLSLLQPGDVIYIAVIGDSLGATSARFRVNGLPPTWTESSLINPFGEFYYQYTLLPGISSYTIEAEIFYPGIGWR